MKCLLFSRSLILSTVLASAVSSNALAQGDVERPVPNFMLLVDTSGSMEWRSKDSAFPTCTPGDPSSTNERSRWIDLVEVLTGTFENYSCFAMNRSTNAFATEFSLDGVQPYDYGYVNPFHRILSGGCTVGPGILPPSNAPYSFPEKAINTFSFTAPATVNRPVNLATHAGCNGFVQAPDGVLDIFKEKARFGLMTFDSHVEQGTGVVSGSADHPSGVSGTWSYFLNDTPRVGRPANCETDQIQEVGARNAAAPPWEGRMVAFGPSDAPGSVQEQRNEYVQRVLLGTRPYGATPIAALLHDARDFYWNDKTADPLDSSNADFGPYRDPTTLAPECRKNFIILLSDGEPNLDLRPFCENTEAGGKCPYQRPEKIAFDLLNNPVNGPNQSVETVVIGFALSKVRPGGGEEISCSELSDEHCEQNPNDRALQACCTLNKIAAEGGRPNSDGSAKKAFFPQDKKELRRTFSQILSEQTTSITTRTSAVFASASSTTAGGSHQFSSGFTPVPEQLWRGKLTRTRIVCDKGAPKELPPDANAGDDFAANVSSGVGDPRRFVTVLAEESSRNTIRPHLTSDQDGLGLSEGTRTALLTDTEFVSQVSAAKMEVSANDCEGSTALQCRDAILGWAVGLTNAENESRCRSRGSADCSLLGAIFHSTPKLVNGRPSEFLRDESYLAFATQQANLNRPSVLYTSTVDGMLHAFKTAPQLADPTQEVNKKANNELWAFIPPAVLPVIQASYPTSPATLLDGTPIIKDVPARVSGGKLFLERTEAHAKSGSGSWRTVLVQSFGKGQVGGGYFALDVTDPQVSHGPEFLWQLTRDADGNPLFGNGGTPIIATVYLKPGAGSAGKETPVAILPGGDSGSRTGEETSAGPLMPPKSSEFAPATTVNEYSGSAEARSLTIVRLDTGAILRTFRAAAHPSISSTVTTIVDIPAPIVGQPAAFPAAAGAVADRLFVGDREGRIWRVDVSNSDPEQWQMQVFFDAYFDQAREKRQPIEAAPILSVDELGQITIASATGEQRVQTAAAGMLNRVVSLTETLDTSNKFTAKTNWIESLGCPGSCQDGQHEGERVTGPMTLFGQALYFASSAPGAASTTQCGTGASRVWGVHYERSQDEAQDAQTINPMNGAAGMLPGAPDALLPPKSTELQPGLVFGVSIEQQPTCSSPTEEFVGDPYLGGYGAHTSLSAVNPGKFSLVYQVGGVTTASPNKVTTTKVELDPPRNSVRIDSWAPIFE